MVRIAGLMRSGTNLLTWMLRHNFSGLRTATMLLGWKHGPIVRDRTSLAMDDYVDPRYRDGIRNFVRDRPQEWARLTASDYYCDAVEAQRAQRFSVALAVRDPALWYASCVRVSRQTPGFLLHDVTPVAAAAFWNEQHRDWLAALGERSVIVDTDGLRRDPDTWLNRMADALRVPRELPLRTPARYLHPQGTEEVYELLGAPIAREMERQFTTLDVADPDDVAAFLGLLDPRVLARLGLPSQEAATMPIGAR